eukprot:jgi/Mesen1/8603/ME000005S08569
MMRIASFEQSRNVSKVESWLRSLPEHLDPPPQEAYYIHDEAANDSPQGDASPSSGEVEDLPYHNAKRGGGGGGLYSRVTSAVRGVGGAKRGEVGSLSAERRAYHGSLIEVDSLTKKKKRASPGGSTVSNKEGSSSVGAFAKAGHRSRGPGGDPEGASSTGAPPSRRGSAPSGSLKPTPFVRPPAIFSSTHTPSWVPKALVPAGGDSLAFAQPAATLPESHHQQHHRRASLPSMPSLQPTSRQGSACGSSNEAGGKASGSKAGRAPLFPSAHSSPGPSGGERGKLSSREFSSRLSNSGRSYDLAGYEGSSGRFSGSRGGFESDYTPEEMEAEDDYHVVSRGPFRRQYPAEVGASNPFEDEEMDVDDLRGMGVWPSDDVDGGIYKINGEEGSSGYGDEVPPADPARHGRVAPREGSERSSSPESRANVEVGSHGCSKAAALGEHRASDAELEKKPRLTRSVNRALAAPFERFSSSSSNDHPATPAEEEHAAGALHHEVLKGRKPDGIAESLQSPDSFAMGASVSPRNGFAPLEHKCALPVVVAYTHGSANAASVGDVAEEVMGGCDARDSDHKDNNGDARKPDDGSDDESGPALAAQEQEGEGGADGSRAADGVNGSGAQTAGGFAAGQGQPPQPQQQHRAIMKQLVVLPPRGLVVSVERECEASPRSPALAAVVLAGASPGGRASPQYLSKEQRSKFNDIISKLNEEPLSRALAREWAGVGGHGASPAGSPTASPSVPRLMLRTVQSLPTRMSQTGMHGLNGLKSGAAKAMQMLPPGFPTGLSVGSSRNSSQGAPQEAPTSPTSVLESKKKYLWLPLPKGRMSRDDGDHTTAGSTEGCHSGELDPLERSLPESQRAAEPSDVPANDESIAAVVGDDGGQAEALGSTVPFQVPPAVCAASHVAVVLPVEKLVDAAKGRDGSTRGGGVGGIRMPSIESFKLLRKESKVHDEDKCREIAGQAYNGDCAKDVLPPVGVPTGRKYADESWQLEDEQPFSDVLPTWPTDNPASYQCDDDEQEAGGRLAEWSPPRQKAMHPEEEGEDEREDEREIKVVVAEHEEDEVCSVATDSSARSAPMHDEDPALSNPSPAVTPGQIKRLSSRWHPRLLEDSAADEFWLEDSEEREGGRLTSPLDERQLAAAAVGGNDSARFSVTSSEAVYYRASVYSGFRKLVAGALPAMQWRGESEDNEEEKQRTLQGRPCVTSCRQAATERRGEEKEPARMAQLLSFSLVFVRPRLVSPSRRAVADGKRWEGALFPASFAGPPTGPPADLLSPLTAVSKGLPRLGA